MKVLILHQHFKTPEPGGAIRSYYLAKALVESGVEVEVITAHGEAYEKKIIEGIVVHFLNVPYRNDYGFIKRGLAFLRFLRKSVRFTKSIDNVDLCYAISVPLTVGLAAVRIKKKYNIPFLFEVGDLWPDAPIQMGFIKNPYLKRYLTSLESRIYSEANAIIALSPAIKEAIESKVSSKTVHLIPNMADIDFYAKESKDPELEVKYKVEGKFVVSYIGATGFANGLSYVIECAKALRMTVLPVHFIICGEGADSETLKARAKQLELTNLSFVEFTNRQGVKELMNITDASFVCYKPFRILETGSPNKFFDGLAAGKLILLNFQGWIKSEIEGNKCGIDVDPFDPGDIVKKIRPFVTDKMLLENYKFNARTLAEAKYSRKELSSQFHSIITSQL